MCCCDVTSCCCGCNSLQRGTIIWAIIDAILNLIFFIATAAPLGGFSPTWICFFMIFWDILLALGAHFRKSGKAHFWTELSSSLNQVSLTPIHSPTSFVLHVCFFPIQIIKLQRNFNDP